MKWFSTCAMVTMVGCLQLPSDSSAQGTESINEPAALNLQQAVSKALVSNPELRVAAFSLRASAAQGTQAGRKPNPELSIQIEDFGGTGRARGVDAAQVTFALSQVIELGAKRTRRVDAANSAYELLEVETQTKQLDVLAEVARRFIHVATDQEQIELTRRARELAATTVTEVGKRVRAGKSPQVELHRARIALTRADLEVEHAEHELLTSRRRMAAMWNDPEAQFGRVVTNLYSLPSPLAFEVLQAKLTENPDFMRFASEERLRDAELRLAQSRRSPNLQVSAGVRRLQETHDDAFVLSFSIPLMIHDRYDGAIAAARARRESIGAEKQAALIRAQAQLFEIYQELRHSIAEATSLRDAMIPQLETVLKETQYAYQRGRYSYLEWVDAQRELLGAHRNLIEASANAHRYLVEIERITGEPLTAPSNPLSN